MHVGVGQVLLNSDLPFGAFFSHLLCEVQHPMITFHNFHLLVFFYPFLIIHKHCIPIPTKMSLLHTTTDSSHISFTLRPFMPVFSKPSRTCLGGYVPLTI